MSGGPRHGSDRAVETQPDFDGDLVRDSFLGQEGSTADRVYAALLSAIEEGVIPPGTRLGEEHVAQLFSVSRTPVREGLFRLETEQLLERDRRGGLFVGRITAQQIIELYVVREALDGAAARLAAHNAQPLQLRRLRHVNEAMRLAATENRIADMAELNIEFHDLLAQASRNEMLGWFVTQVHGFVRRFRTTTFSHADRAVTAVEEHDALIDAITRGEVDEAERIAREHMRRAMDIRVIIEADTEPSP